MVARAYTVAFQGVEARTVEVQCALSPGLPAFSIVGLPDKAVSEARDRVRAALGAMAIALPSRRITVNLSPADLPKEGSHFDLPIALALLGSVKFRGQPCPLPWPPPQTTARCCVPQPRGPKRRGCRQPR